MRKLFSVLVSVMVVVLLVTSSGMAYDKVRPTETVLGTTFDDTFTYVRVVATGTAIGMIWDDKNRCYDYSEGYWAQTGSGVVAATGYVVTAAHVIAPDTITLPEGKCSSRHTDVIGRTSRLIMLFDCKGDPVIGKVLYENVQTDLAVITYNHKKAFWFKPTPHKPVYVPQYIQPNDVVCAVVHTRDKNGRMDSGVELRWGTVASPTPTAPREHAIAYLNPWDITLNLAIQPGDSGSPLFAFWEGKPYFIGIVRAYYFDGFVYYAYAVQLPVVDKILNRARG